MRKTITMPIGGVQTQQCTGKSAGTIRPLDDLVAKYGSQPKLNQLVRIDGKIMAITMMVSTI